MHTDECCVEGAGGQAPSGVNEPYCFPQKLPHRFPVNNEKIVFNLSQCGHTSVVAGFICL